MRGLQALLLQDPEDLIFQVQFFFFKPGDLFTVPPAICAFAAAYLLVQGVMLCEKRFETWMFSFETGN
ncbi:hypothetical protein SR38_03795 [Atlantibacter hermannii]|nr:hypothetical protein SR38_03795 [Atlantibacter hermannii]